MSLIDSIHASLGSMGFLQLALAFGALLAYSLALSAAFVATVRAGAVGVALVGAIGFAAATPQWVDGVVLMALAIAGCGAFAGAAWLLSQGLGVGGTRGSFAAQTGQRDLALPARRVPRRPATIAIRSS